MTAGRMWRVLGVLALLATQGCWLQGGFDARRSGFNFGETGITAATVAQLAPAWTATVTGGAPREPIVFDGTAYFRASGALTALDTATGATRWTATGLSGSGLPVLADNRLWVPAGGGHCELSVLDLGSGAVTEHHTFGGPDLNGISGAFSSCQVGDTLWTGAKLATVWTYIGSSPAPHSCPNLIVNVSGAGFAAVDFQDPNGDFSVGTANPTCDIPPVLPLPGPLTSDDSFIYASNAHGAVGYPVTCSSSSSCVSAFSWGPGITIVPSVSPLPGGNEAVVVQPDGHVAVVDAHTGATHWTGTLGTSASLPPAVTDTTIFALADDGTLSAFPVGGCGASTCPATWTAQLPAAATGRPNISGDVLYVGSADGTLTALPANGCGAAACSALFTATVPGAVAGSPVADGGALYVGSSTGTVTAYKLPS